MTDLSLQTLQLQACLERLRRGDETARDELMRHATRKRYEYRHEWRHGDSVLWDNRSVMHQANPDYDMNERRYLYRLMLKGETPV